MPDFDDPNCVHPWEPLDVFDDPFGLLSFSSPLNFQCFSTEKMERWSILPDCDVIRACETEGPLHGDTWPHLKILRPLSKKRKRDIKRHTRSSERQAAAC
jgi:hypothetical protein